MQQGNIGVTTENIFPIIKKFLYSDHEIFLRELVSNAVDASQKLKTLASVGEYKGDVGTLMVRVTLDKDAKTITISDNGIGMTSEEIEKYINQIAFSGAEEFVGKYKADAHAIIGHFGLGFYSAFMVSKKVEIFTKSCKEGAQAVHWSCEGDPSFTMTPVDKATRGTDIILHIDDENLEFLEQPRIEGLLKKYCRFLPVAIAFGKRTEWKDGKSVETDEDNVINNTQPAWTRKPADLTPEDYDNFYHELYPMAEDPMFHIHLNVDFPFNLTGILYFPRIKSNIEMQRNKIQLYCNQVFVTDSVEGIVPEFLTLLHGVLDSPDIPLNVSRSYLQSDGNVKKIAAHITKKVADRLHELFKEDRKVFEDKWADLKLFIQYGMLTDEKFYDQVKKFALLTNVDGKHLTFEEYRTLISANQKDKNGDLIYLYANNRDQQYSYIERAQAKGYDVLLMDGQLDVHVVAQLEQKFEKSRFVRVDSDVVDKLIQKADATTTTLTAAQQVALEAVFSSQLPVQDKVSFTLGFEEVGADAQPLLITQNEFMRRMKEMSAMQGGGGMMNFYGEMPDSYSLIVNTAHPLVSKVLQDANQACGAQVEPIAKDLAEVQQQKEALEGKNKGKKPEDIATADKDEESKINELEKKLKSQQRDVFAGFAQANPQVRQMVDLALLSNNMLKGEALSRFIKRSVEML